MRLISTMPPAHPQALHQVWVYPPVGGVGGAERYAGATRSIWYANAYRLLVGCL